MWETEITGSTECAVRITSYNVCYTKLLRSLLVALGGLGALGSALGQAGHEIAVGLDDDAVAEVHGDHVAVDGIDTAVEAAAGQDLVALV